MNFGNDRQQNINTNSLKGIKFRFWNTEEKVIMCENSLHEKEMEEDYSLADVKQTETHQQVGCQVKVLTIH